MNGIRPVTSAVAFLGLSVWGQWGKVFGRGHSTGTTTGLLLRTILRKSLVLMSRVKIVEKYTKHACYKKSIV